MSKVSILLPVFNGAKTIERALGSLRAQSWTDFEVLVVNDASTDETETIVRRLAEQDARIHYHGLSENKGVSVARNKALSLAKGDWITVLDADDWYEPDRLERMLILGQELGADLLLDNLAIWDHALGRKVDQTNFMGRKSPVRIDARTLFLKDSPYEYYALGYARPMFRAAFLRAFGLRYNETLRLGEDFMLLAEVVLRGARSYVLPQAGYVYVQRLSPTSGALSPHSRSMNDYEDILRAGQELLANYGENVSASVRRAMKRRLHIFSLLNAARKVKRALGEGQYIGALQEAARQPGLLYFSLRVYVPRRIRQAWLRLKNC